MDMPNEKINVSEVTITILKEININKGSGFDFITEKVLTKNYLQNALKSLHLYSTQ